MANPRKFSEKIALHNQKQAEETAAFEQIMREVIGATRVTSAAPVAQPLRNNHLHINQSVGNCRAGSLPNVNHIGHHNDNGAIDLQSALNNLDDIRHGREPRDRRNMSPIGRNNNNNSAHQPSVHRGRQMHFSDHKRADASPYSTPYLSPPDVWRRTNSDSALHHSALLADQQDSNSYYSNVGSPSSPRRNVMVRNSNAVVQNMPPVTMEQSGGVSWDPGKRINNQEYLQYDQQQDDESFRLLTASMLDGSDIRPKSCEVPGITIYPTQDDQGHSHSHHHIPLSSNTGSLPDLTNLHFPAPLSTPIDLEDQASAGTASTQMTNSLSSSYQYNTGPGSPFASGAPPPSPYSTTSNCNSPSPYSPQSPHSVNSPFSPPPVPNSHLSGGVMYEATPDGTIKATTLNGSVSLGNGRISHTMDNGLYPAQQVGQGYCQSSNRAPSTAPRITVEGLTMDTSALSLDGNTRYANIGQNSSNSYDERTHSSVPKGHNYLPPSPSQQQTMGLHRSSTPSEHSCSAPTSPVSHNTVPSPINSPGLPQNAANTSSYPFTNTGRYNIQQINVIHQLEQFKMVPDLQADVEHFLMMPGSVVHSSSSSASSSNGGLYMSSLNTIAHSPRGSLGDGTCDYSPQTSPQSNCVATSGMNESPATSVFYSSSDMLPLNIQTSATPSIYSKSVISSVPSSYQQIFRQPIHSPAPQTPNSSIPDIILTDANSEESLLRQDFAKELGSSMASMSNFDANDLFSSDAFKSDLPIDPIDFDGLQILTDITDSQSDDNFRLSS